jgi:hypothetical protein
MGAGKTESAISKMKEDKQSNYIFITPYLDEVDRIKSCCTERNFVSPINKGDGKLGNLHYLLGKSENIASTHALFKDYTDYTLELIRNGDYKLILDEVFDVVEKIDIHKDDLKLLIDDGIIEVKDGYVKWLDDEYDGNFKYLKPMAKSGNIIIHEDYLMLWTFPIEAFEAFQEVTVLAYLFDAQIQKYYYDLNGVEIEKIGTCKDENGYRFIDKTEMPEYTKSLINKIHILEDDKLNTVGDNSYSLSVSWFKRETKVKGKPLLKKIKNNLQNVFTNKYKTNANYNMWTTFKDYKSYLSGKGYTSGFLSYNIRATNEYRHKTHLAYCCNVYFNPHLKNFFVDKGVDVKEDEYALSELIQWIWRSAIRSGQEIWIYIPSKRMRELLNDWLLSLNN